MEKQDAGAGEGCLTAVVRWVARVVALVVVVPLRFGWELACLVGRAVRRVAYWVLVWPLVWLYRSVLTPVGRGLAWLARGAGRGLAWLGRVLVVAPLVWLYRWVLTPVGRALGWLGRVLLVAPLSWLGRWVVVPLGRGLLAVLLAVGGGIEALGRGLGRLAKAFYRYGLTPLGWALGWLAWAVPAGLGWLVRMLLVVPVQALWRYGLAPVGRGIRWLLRGLGAGVLWLLRGFGAVVGWLVHYLVVVPVQALYRWVLAPAGRAVGWLLGWVWRTLLYPVLRAVGLAVAWAWRIGGRIWRFLVVRPCRWVRREVWWPVKEEIRRTVRGVREAVREARRALLG